MRRLAMRMSGWLVSALLMCACSGAAIQGGDTQSSEPSAMLLIESTPTDPHVLIDGGFQGKVSRWRERTIPVPAGARRLELLHDGYYPYRADLELKPGRLYTLRVRMVRHHDP